MKKKTCSAYGWWLFCLQFQLQSVRASTQSPQHRGISRLNQTKICSVQKTSSIIVSLHRYIQGGAEVYHLHRFSTNNCMVRHQNKQPALFLIQWFHFTIIKDSLMQSSLRSKPTLSGFGATLSHPLSRHQCQVVALGLIISICISCVGWHSDCRHATWICSVNSCRWTWRHCNPHFSNRYSNDLSELKPEIKES